MRVLIATGVVIASTVLSGYTSGKLCERRAEEQFKNAPSQAWYQHACQDAYFGKEIAESQRKKVAYDFLQEKTIIHKFRGARDGLLISGLLALVGVGIARKLQGETFFPEEEPSGRGSRAGGNQGYDPDTWSRTSGERPLGL